MYYYRSRRYSRRRLQNRTFAPNTYSNEERRRAARRRRHELHDPTGVMDMHDVNGSRFYSPPRERVPRPQNPLGIYLGRTDQAGNTMSHPPRSGSYRADLRRRYRR